MTANQRILCVSVAALQHPVETDWRLLRTRVERQDAQENTHG
jgi:hypothetical protein